MGRIKELLNGILYILVILLAQKIVYYVYSLGVFRYCEGGAGFIRGFYPDSLLSDAEIALKWIRETQFYTLILGWILGLGLIFLIVKLTHQKPFSNLTQRLGAVNLLLTAIIGFGVVFLTNGLVLTLECFVPLPEMAFGYENTAIPFWVILLSVGILVPVAEEILFRGFVMGKLMESGWETYAVIVQTLLFSASHMNFGQGLSVLILGFVCGYVVLKTRSIKASIVIHSLFNLTNLYMEQTDLSMDAIGQLIVLMVIGAVLIALGFEKLRYA